MGARRRTGVTQEIDFSVVAFKILILLIFIWPAVGDPTE
jgi:hypothetical protein